MKQILLVVCLVTSIAISYAQDPTYNKGINFKTDNDSYLFFGQDQYYTSGIFLSFQNAYNTPSEQSNIAKKIWELSFAQKMYNPYSGNVKAANKQDRPFAAYLYGAAAHTWLLRNETVFKTSLALGIVGESAKGEESQKFIHNLLGFYPINGWEHQIKDVTSIVATLEIQRLLYRNQASSIDLSVESVANLGNTHINLGLGPLLRLGNINQLFQSNYTNSVVSKAGFIEKLHSKESYFYIKPSVYLIGRDATIQGANNKISPVTFGIKRLVYAQVFGYSYSTPRFTFDYRVQLNSKEVKSKAEAHEFGSFSFQYRFN